MGVDFKAIRVNYLMMDTLLPYKVILGRPTIKFLGMIISIQDLILKYLLPSGRFEMVRRDQESIRECCMRSLAKRNADVSHAASPLLEAHDIDTINWDPIMEVKNKRLTPI